MRFNLRTLALLVLATAFLLGLGTNCVRAVIGWWKNPYVNVRVTNLTDRPLTNVTVRYAEMEWNADSIGSGKTAVWNIGTPVEGFFELSFRDAEGALKHDDFLEGVESGHRGWINVRIDDEGLQKSSSIYTAFPF